jgi:hypothetical protein
MYSIGAINTSRVFYGDDLTDTSPVFTLRRSGCVEPRREKC